MSIVSWSTRYFFHTRLRLARSELELVDTQSNLLLFDAVRIRVIARKVWIWLEGVAVS